MTHVSHTKKFHPRGMRFARLGLAATLALAAPLLAMAQTSFAPVPSPSFVIQGFDITGDNPLDQAETTRILAPYLRTDATLETLQKATAALEASMKEKGFALHRVGLPAQDVGPTIKLNVVKFVIGKVVIDGSQRYSEENVRNSLPELIEGTSPNFRTLAVQTAIANESPGKRVQVALKAADQPDKIDARIILQEGSPWMMSAALSNAGNEATGNDRLTLSAGHANLWDKDHQLSAAYTTSLERPSAVQQLGLSYRLPLYRLGGVLGFTYTQSDVAGNFGAFTSTGAGKTMGANYNLYLQPDGGYRGYVAFGLDDKQFDVTQINGVPLPGQVLRRSRPLSVGYNARIETDATVWGYNTDVVLNLGGGSGNDVSAYRTEDQRISTAQWRALRGGGYFTTSVSDGWLLSVRGQFQFSPDALISGEQFGLGGASSVRGTSERPLSGDSGALLTGEVSTPEWIAGMRLLGFVDSGWLSNNNPNGNPKPANDSLSSVGVGLRYSTPQYSLTADFGHVLSGTTMPILLNSGLPQKGDQKLHVNLTARF